MTNESLNRRSTWQRHLDDQLSSGLSQRDFCASRGLSLASFGYWKKRLAKVDSASASGPLFLPVRPERPRFESVRLSHPGGLTIEIPIGSDLRWIRRLLEEVMSP
jgi:hypothetical protein